MIRHPAGARHWTARKPHLIKRGTESHAAKLMPDDIAAIKATVAARPTINRSWLARKYGVNRITIWRHIKDM